MSLTPRPYQRFVAVGPSRAGWNMLRTSLGEHPAIVCHDEPFRDKYPKPYAYNTEAAVVVDEHLFTPFQEEIQAVGFKVQVNQPSFNLWWRSVWDLVRADREIKILHVRRRNLLARLLSEINAERTMTWVVPKGMAPPKPTPLVLTREQCLHNFHLVTRQQDLLAEFFGDHAVMDVIYEDVCADFQGKMNAIQEFLGVAPTTLRPWSRKIAQRPLPESIANYAGLNRSLQGSPWSSFFEEQSTT
ncbi:hypothetical protein Pan216_25630 [Planctomycetes bacterium Pan216]|uniref:Sulfotransferase family protein n=1 Tax=Kolteria novifilia TaxID=2527975 RepID=A0A518B3Y0_9BACT|nr:hypothetical protein Pan216_25630 [Planctomycetes bacterium Pan216]